MTTAFASAISVVAESLAAALAPRETTSPSQYGAQNIVLVEGPRSGQLWDPAQAPYVNAIIDTVFCGPHVKGTVKKSAQTGFTQGIIVCEGWIAAQSPARCLHVLPTISLATSYNRSKLQPTIDASPDMRSRIADTTKKRGVNSSAFYKAFPGGSIEIVGANSAADLQMHTIKYAFCDEIDQWPKDLDEQGSPMAMVDGRQIAFHATHDYRKLQGGTPTLKGASLVDREFEAGDQRYQRLPCPHCGTRIRLVFGGYVDEPGGTGLRFNRKHPVDAHYIPPCCGARIEHWQKAGMIASAMDLPDYGFVPEVPEPGRHPSWHIDAIGSNFTTWDKIAEAFIAAGDDPKELKVFYNTWLGLAFEDKADRPDWQIIYKRRESYAARLIPADGLIVLMGVDVQKRGLYVEISAWTPDRRSYTLLATFIPAGSGSKPGDTSDPDDECWVRLSELHETPLPDALGNTRRLDATGVDCRFNAPVVYDWVRRHDNAYAIRTEEGWTRPALTAPKLVDYDWRGKRIRRGVHQWISGSYNLKARFYAYLNREQSVDETGRIISPPGYCHFGIFLDENYFRQITSEYVGPDKAGNRIWKQSDADNHWLDCRVLAMALAFGAPAFDIGNRPESFWTDLAYQRGVSESIILPLLPTTDVASSAEAAAREDQKLDGAPAPADPEPRREEIEPPHSVESWSYSGGSWL
jgi:phage terminase large subunit GpA-like protein